MTWAAGMGDFNSRALDVPILEGRCVSVPGNSVYTKWQFTRKWNKEEKNAVDLLF